MAAICNMIFSENLFVDENLHVLLKVQFTDSFNNNLALAWLGAKQGTNHYPKQIRPHLLTHLCATMTIISQM